MGLPYYWWVFRRGCALTSSFFVLALIGWVALIGNRAYLHFLANALPIWAMLFVAYAARYKIKQTYYRDVLRRAGDEHASSK